MRASTSKIGKTTTIFRALDVDDIRRVIYECGFAKNLKNAFSGRGLQTSVWTAPAIPREILDSISREALLELEGDWGDPRAGLPIQVDRIDLETDGDVISVEIFNRAILLMHHDRDEVRRIHRVCEVLAAAAHSSEPTDTGGIRTQAVESHPRFGLEKAITLHRRQPGICDLCGTSISRTAAARHFAECAPRHDAKGELQTLVHLRITAPHHAGYWLDVEARVEARLDALDRCSEASGSSAAAI